MAKKRNLQKPIFTQINHQTLTIFGINSSFVDLYQHCSNDIDLSKKRLPGGLAIFLTQTYSKTYKKVVSPENNYPILTIVYIRIDKYHYGLYSLILILHMAASVSKHGCRMHMGAFLLFMYMYNSI